MERIKIRVYEYNMLIDFQDSSVFINWHLRPEQPVKLLDGTDRTLIEQRTLKRIVSIYGVDITEVLSYEDKANLLEDCYERAASTKPAKRLRQTIEVPT